MGGIQPMNDNFKFPIDQLVLLIRTNRSENYFQIVIEPRDFTEGDNNFQVRLLMQTKSVEEAHTKIKVYSKILGIRIYLNSAITTYKWQLRSRVNTSLKKYGWYSAC